MSTTNPVDPRTQITPDSFTVAPELLGLPLARPWRRAGAMIIDLLAVALLANAGAVFLAFAAAIALWRASSSEKGGFVRKALRLGAAAVLFIAILNTWNAIANRAGDGDGVRASIDDRELDLGVADLRTLPDIIALTTSTDTAEVRNAARAIAARIDAGADVDARRDVVSELLGDVEDPVARQILRDAIAAAAPVEAPSTPSADSVVLAYADALARGDTARADELRPAAASVVARDSLDRLARRADRLAESNSQLRNEMERIEERSGGFMGFLRNIADDMGIGVGWGALYFSAFLALWRGQTPGKRLFGLRVIRLDGRPIGWWIAFERFGSYAASLSTGLLGFAQIIWDRNRQGLHDKAVETVVIRDLPASVRSKGTWQPAGR